MNQEETIEENELDGQMSFLDHFDEFRKRLVRSVAFVFVAFLFCFYFSAGIYNFLSIPIIEALSEAQRRDISIKDGLTGNEKVLRLSELKEGDKGRFVFDRATNIGVTVVASGTSVLSVVARDKEDKLGLYTDEAIYTSNSIVPKGIKLPVDFNAKDISKQSSKERMTVTKTAQGFTLYLTVSLYAALALSIPFLLLQIWGFVSPALYKHERKYVTPFVLLSSISFVLGAAFAYYILFPPAVRFLLGVSKDFQLLLDASDYLDFILIIMLAMGVIFQMPAIAYVLSRIGVISAGFLVKSWKIALVVMLIVAAFVSPTGDIPNMMLFALPMFALYVISILIALFFGKKRESDEERNK